MFGNSDFETVFELIRFDWASRCPLDDDAIELAAILGVPLEEAERLTKQTPDSYHRVGGSLSTEMAAWGSKRVGCGFEAFVSPNLNCITHQIEDVC